jgi:hypothetical protein
MLSEKQDCQNNQSLFSDSTAPADNALQRKSLSGADIK